MKLLNERFQMTRRHWLKLFGFCLVFNVIALILPIAAVLSLFSPAAIAFVPVFGLLLGIPIALVPTVVTILPSMLLSRLMGYFSFGQFFTTGTIAASALAWREISRDNAEVQGNLFILTTVLPVIWWLGWLAAKRWRILPKPIVEAGIEPRRWILLISSLVTIGAVVGAAFAASHDFQVRREAERRGVCPENLVCTTFAAGANYEPRTTVHVARMAGQQFVVPANSLGSYLRNADDTPGEVGFIEIEGVLPDFEPLSSDNLPLFRSRESIGTATLRPICHRNAACREQAPSKWAVRVLNGWMPDLVGGTDLPILPNAFEYMGDFWRHDGFGPTTTENATHQLFGLPNRNGFIVCGKENSVLTTYCEHAFFWREFEVVLVYPGSMLMQWREMQTAVITKLERFMAEEDPPLDASYISDPLPSR